MPHADPDVRRAYMQKYQREWCARRRAAFFEDKLCERCRSSELLELDHKDPSQKITSVIWSWSQVRREAEIAKCQILCRDCHKKKTVESREHAYGERMATAKLSETNVLEIRRRWKEGGVTKRGMAREYNVNESLIRAVITRRIWTHI